MIILLSFFSITIDVVILIRSPLARCILGVPPTYFLT